MAVDGGGPGGCGQSNSPRSLSLRTPHQVLHLALGLTWLVVLLHVPAAWAQHFDVELRTSGGPVAGSRITTAFFGDAVIGGQLPVDAVTGYKMFPGFFGDFEGGPFLTDDPGFQAFSNTFVRREEVHFRALGVLQYWNPATGRWGSAGENVAVALFGGVPTEVIVGYTENPTAWQSQYDYYAAGTRFTQQGIEGPPTALIDDASSSGAFHAHLDWRISARGDEPPVGAYMVTLELWSPTTVNGQLKYLPSEPIQIVFERGISEAQLQAAIQARITPPPPAACLPATLRWQTGGLSCAADTPSAESGASVVAFDSTGPVFGRARFTCADGLWSSAAEASCAPASNGACGAQIQSWTVNGQTCSGATESVSSGGSAAVHDHAEPALGSAIFLCSSGNWGLVTAATCAVPVSQNCVAQDVVWSAGGYACQASVSAGPASTVVRVQDSQGPALGSGQFACVGGSWQQVSQPTAQCGALKRSLTLARPRAPWSPPQALPWQGP